MHLSAAVGLAVLAGVALAALAEWVLLSVFHPKAGGTSVDVTKLALTVVGGVGGVVALVIAYRRQRDLEQGRFVERFGAAAAQLGASDVAVRIAGVYAMAGVADEAFGPRRQQCIDVLCGYLRLPCIPDLGANHQTKLVLKHHRGRADGTLSDDEEQHLEYRQNDREVRKTITRVIAAHVRSDARYSWSSNNFDFCAAYLIDADFNNATFAGSVDFTLATFAGHALFAYASFSGDARFESTTFTSAVVFGYASFSGDARFESTTFYRDSSFGNATFSGDAVFGYATFSGDARFESATFSHTALFGDATFSRDARFGYATFSGEAWFQSATFSRDAIFESATFSHTAAFGAATFSHTAAFESATFSRAAAFGYATFSSYAKFKSATFSGTTVFGAAQFASGGDFTNADFGAEQVSFEGPRQWGSPPPAFDWDSDVSKKPANVLPLNWPPLSAPAIDPATSAPPGQ